MKEDSKCTKIIIKILILIIIAVFIGILSYIVWQSSESESDTPKPQQKTEETKKVATPEIKLDKTYVLPKEELRFDFPSSWKIKSNFKEDGTYTENDATLTNEDGNQLDIYIPNSGPRWQFGERITPCPFDKEFDANSPSYQPSVCPAYKQLYTEPVKKLDGVSTYVFEKTYPVGSDLKNEIVMLVAKNGCTGTDQALCERPDAKTGYHIHAEFSVDYDPTVDFMKTQTAKDVIAILKSLQYVETNSKNIN